MKIAIITANMGNFDKKVEHIDQSIPVDYFHFTDENFPPRTNAMTARLQARIPKLFGWQMVKGYNFYIWVDSSLMLSSENSVQWFIKQCRNSDAAFFKHPDRNTIKEEGEFIKRKIVENNYYLMPRYKNELVDEELAEIEADKGYTDNLLIASSAFIYRNTESVRNMMKEWWYHTSRYHIVDQLGLPYAIYKSGVKINLINEHYMRILYLKYVRNK